LRKRQIVRYPDIDYLYTEILKQQKDQKFLTGLLTSLVLFSEHPLFVGFDWIYQTVPLITVMLNLKDGVISAKLRGMHSLLKVSSTSIGVHHISFLDFLNRGSHRYHVPCRRANWIILKLFASRTIRFYRWPFWSKNYDHLGAERLQELITYFRLYRSLGLSILHFIVHLIILLTCDTALRLGGFVDDDDFLTGISAGWLLPLRFTLLYIFALLRSLSPSILVSVLLSELLFKFPFFHFLFHPWSHPIFFFRFDAVFPFLLISCLQGLLLLTQGTG